MKSNLLLCFAMHILPLPSAMLAQLPETQLKTTPSRITIHLKGAELVHGSTANLKPGRQRVVFTGLSPKLNPQSVQVTATNGVQILSVTSKTNHFSITTLTPAAQVLEDSVDLLAARMQALKDEKTAFEKEKEVLVLNQQLSGKDQALPVEQLMKAADFYRARFKEINMALTAIEGKYRDTEYRMRNFQQQIREISSKVGPNSEVFVDIDARGGGTTELKLRYVVDNAGWSPVYDLTSTNINEPVRLKYRALAFNDSGLDWNDVVVRLSTADPYQGAGQPQLQTWALRNAPNNYDLGKLQQQQNNRAQLELNQQSQNLNTMPDKPVTHDLNPDIRYDKTDDKARVVFETIEISELSTDFDIATPYTIPADGKPYSIEITEHQLDASHKHFAVPKLDKDAFLLAQVTGWEKLDLITGPVNVYRNDNFIGVAQLNPRILSDTLELSLGRDANVVIKREKVKEYSRKQFLGGNKFTSFSWKISVKNNHKLPISLELQDQVPVSEVKEITVEVKETSGARRIDSTGKLIWGLTLQPGEVKTVSLAFTVKHPDNMEVEMEKMRKVVTPRYF